MYVPHGCPLSQAELMVLCGLADGFTYKQIAFEADCTYSTICSQSSSIYRKLHVKGRAQAILRATREGWIASDQVAIAPDARILLRLETLVGELLLAMRKRATLAPRQRQFLSAFDSVLHAQDDDDYIAARELMSHCTERAIAEAGIEDRDRPQRDLVGLLVDFVENQKALD